MFKFNPVSFFIWASIFLGAVPIDRLFRHSFLASVEAAAKLGGLRAIKNIQYWAGRYDNCHELFRPRICYHFFKGLHELSMQLRNSEMLLRGVEALLTNLFSQKFNNPRNMLDSFCNHVHMTLTDVKSRARH